MLLPMGRIASLLALAAATLIVAGIAGATPRNGNGKIALMTLRDGRGEIDVVGSDGTGGAGVTTAGLNAEPAWSPEGTRIAYVCANFSLCLMNADGSGQRALTDTGTWSGKYVYDEYPTWSPDGKKLAFQSNRGDLNYGIWVVNSDGSQLHRLAGNAAGDGDYSPSWSPDGNRIAFESDNGDSYDIYLMSPDGSLFARLTRTDDDEDSPAWSPDATKIVYVRWRGDFSNLWLMNADGSGQHALTKGPADDFSPVWSPDGTKILFSSDRGGNIDLYVMNADGSGRPSRLTTAPEVEGFPSWQPIPPTPSGQPPLPVSTAPVAQNDAPLVSQIFGRLSELGAVNQAIFEARSRHSIAAQRLAYARLASSTKHAALTLKSERPTSAKGRRLQSLVVRAFQKLSIEGRERILATDARRRGNHRAQKRHERAADRAAAQADNLVGSAADLIG
jgi:dipeptidyl aminopeptidase/acylaminoacyl peptidase